MNIGMCVRMGGAVFVLGGLFLAGSGVIDLSGVTPAGADHLPGHTSQLFDKPSSLGAIGTGFPGEGLPREERHTLQWDRRLRANERFVVLPAFNNNAVRDNETGLVWEKSPHPETNGWAPCPHLLHQQDRRQSERLAVAIHS